MTKFKVRDMQEDAVTKLFRLKKGLFCGVTGVTNIFCDVLVM